VGDCGLDTALYFRIFNRVTQAKKFNADGEYVRSWVPELAGLSSRWIHQPWMAPPSALIDAGVRLGQNYPFPIVDHTAARAAALAAFAQTKAAR
jgi:deoxyribodipyrimidine photo-lyase